MSVFDNNQDDNHSSENNDEDKGGTTEPRYVDLLVKERGENWSDPEVIAKGKIESDKYIKDLESQMAELREDLAKQDYSAALLEELRNNKETGSHGSSADSSNQDSDADMGDTTSKISEEDLKNLVEETLTAREHNALASKNKEIVDTALVKEHGTGAKEYIEGKAKELGLSISRMEELAKESPTAFFNLIGHKDNSASLTSGNIRTEAVGIDSGGERNWAYYQKLRRENRSLYFSPKVQQQLAQDRQRLGDRFGIS